MKKKKQTDEYLKHFIVISIALLAASIAFPFIVNYHFSDWSKSGPFGDTFGALNTLFSGLALSGVIVTILIQKRELEHQRIELSLQRTEMQETRKEFLINRTTNLVYNQLDRFEKSLQELTIVSNGITYKGNDAISFLDENKKTVYKQLDKSEDDYNHEMKNTIIELIKLYSPNKSQIEKFAHNAYNSVEVLKRLIYKTNLEIEELNDIKNLFFVNIGFINMGVIERISEISEKELVYLKPSDFVESGIDVGTMFKANVFLESIKEFYRLRLTEENYNRLKADWINDLGENEL